MPSSRLRAAVHLVSFAATLCLVGRTIAQTGAPAASESRPGLGEPGRLRPPNVVILLADDLGYADVGVHGCKDVPTPGIDAIARAGVRCTSGYAGHNVCAPSRAALLSGRYQHRFGLELNPGPAATAAPEYGLPRSVPTLAEKLQALGYATGMVGKWHLGYSAGLRPHERGFAFHFGFLGGAHPYVLGRRGDAIVRNGAPVEEKEYLTDAFAREAVGFIERSKDRPFFLYLAFNAVHTPLQTTVERERRFAGIADPKRRTYAGMLSALDDAVGRVMEKLREIGQEENTLVFFYSDNGGPSQANGSRNDPLRGNKGQMFEGGIRVPFLVQWKGRLPAGGTFERPVMNFDIHATALAAAGATPTADLDGVDLLPFLGTGKGEPHPAVFWRGGATHAARVGDWKLVRERAGGDQLFDLAADVGERTNLAERNPAKLAEIQAAYAAWERQMPARPQGRGPRNAAAASRPASRATSRPATNVATAFRRYDRDGDGKISTAELGRPRLFRQADLNGDGVLSREEFAPIAPRAASRPSR